MEVSHRRIQDERRFDDPTALTSQIRRDVAEARDGSDAAPVSPWPRPRPACSRSWVIPTTMSPLMHNAVLRALGLDCVYVALEVSPDPRGLAPAIRTLGLRGANLTVPFKQTVLEHLDALAPSAARAGAVNTVVNEGGTCGPGTPTARAAAAPRRAGRPPIARAVVLGAGGTGCAVSAALRARGAAVVLLNRAPPGPRPPRAASRAWSRAR